MIQLMKEYSGAILVTANGGVVLQRRDNIPSIKDPGMLSIFAGAMLKGETKEEAVIREVEEETGLRLKQGQIDYFGSFRLDGAVSHAFICESIDPSNLVIREGTGWELLEDYVDFQGRSDVAPISATILNNYFRSVDKPAGAA